MTVPPLQSSVINPLASLAAGGNPKQLARMPATEQTRAAAAQFEAILIRQFLQQSMGDMLGGASGGPSGSIYGHLLTDVFATKLAEGGGFGLSSVIQQQLAPRPASSAEAPKANAL